MTFFEIIFLISEDLLVSIQKVEGAKITGKKKTTQFKLRLMTEEGSKIENILIIFFRKIYGKLN